MKSFHSQKFLHGASLAFLLALMGALGTPHAAQAAPTSPSESVAADPAMTDGEIRKVDMEAGKITIKHGELKNLSMPPMTMVFRAKEAGMLQQVKSGDKVRFAADKVNGQFTVMQIELAQ